ncbi:hypothetical protein E2C01_102106 [Portunus trituberculatus]|uniref:Uncharacterized protein n=1 Tax=Portunus trituberculatus TaxID=210409 RepID=A0A5B7KBQ0_PORTR|nr:hypothetical protein [Portunus trituberculatus]
MDGESRALLILVILQVARLLTEHRFSCQRGRGGECAAVGRGCRTAKRRFV